MQKLKNLKPEKVFKYFEQISSIPRGSGNMKNISNFCMEFAKTHSLKAIRDDADNVIIFKDASQGYENSEPVILQGHLDMVCQKDDNISIDFEKDGLDLYIDGDFIKARGTTLGADNGIAVAMILAILESDDISHPPIEAVFTTDEETGMIGAGKLCFDNLKGKRMINLDSEDAKTLTVSCAGGSDFVMMLPVKRQTVSAKKVLINIEGLKGGHSGVEINSKRVNANILAGRILNFAKSICDFDIISIDGGDKGNAIPNSCKINLAVNEPLGFIEKIEEYVKIIKSEISEREIGFKASLLVVEEGSFNVIDSISRDNLIFMLVCAPNGVIEMSAQIDNLVETSLNLGILKTEDEKITAHFTLRSNKESALKFLEERLFVFSKSIGCETKAFGHYPSWEYKENSYLEKTYKRIFKEEFGYDPTVVAIHAGLECGVFASQIEDFDCISIGPEMYDVHTTCERLSISSTKDIYKLVLNVLKECK